MDDRPKSNDRQGKSMLGAALDYAGRGWAMFPLWSVRGGVCTCRKQGRCQDPGKHPRTRTGFRGATVDKKAIQRWRWETANIGVATGAASGLVVIDIDPRHEGDKTMRALLTEHGKLPRGPKVKTGGGGWHLYFQHPGRQVSSRNGIAPGIDIKADGGYVVAPPSIHANGGRYQWEIAPDDVDLPNLPESWLDWILDPSSCYTENTGNSDYTRIPMTTQITQAITCLCDTKKESGLVNLEDLVIQNLPTGPGRRNRQVFELARAIKSIAYLVDAANNDLDQIKPYVLMWHNEGIRRGLISTVPFEETWIDFLRAWPKVKFPKGAEPMTVIFQQAKQRSLPRAAGKYESQGLQLLVALCCELQKAAGQEPFFLACRTAGSLLGVSHMQANRWLFLLTHDGVLELVERGDRTRRRASQYRYVAS